MARFETFGRDIKVATAGLEPDAIAAKLASHARAELARVIQTGQASHSYEKYVNGRQGAAEESVVAPGPIVYIFTNWPLLIRTALAELEKRVPKRSGRYASSFIVMVDGGPVRAYKDIRPGATVTIFNAQPYTRKMEVGANRTGRRHYELSRQALFRRFGQEMLYAQIKYITPPAGLHPLVPYVLKGNAPARLAKADRRSSAFRSGRKFLARRADTAAGQKLSYPALVMSLL